MPLWLSGSVITPSVLVRRLTRVSPQICRFCWHHIKENLNGRCPACRREYTTDAVQFKPINNEECVYLVPHPQGVTDIFHSHKRLTQQKKQRERERKDLETLGRRHLTNVRVVQRNVVYIVNMNPRFAKEEVGQSITSRCCHFVTN